MLKIRLQRIGRKNMPAFRIIVAEHTRGPRTGNIVEKVGTYNPKTKEKQFNADRIMSGFGLPTKNGATPVAVWMRAAIAPQAGMMPLSVGPLASGLVAIKRAPFKTRRTAREIWSKL